MTGYAEELLGEARRARGSGRLPAPTRTGQAVNHVCGDEIELDVDDDGEHVLHLAHRTRGCAFTRGSASLLSRAVTGMTVAAARELCDRLRRDVPGTVPLPQELAMLAEVRMYPARLRCALLPWDALSLALDRE